jgi:chromosomal replication initiation ATPase DnaA
MGKVNVQSTTITNRAKDSRRVTEYDVIFGAIRRELKITKQQIISKSRFRDVAEARQMFCMFARDLVKESSVKVGQQIKRDHATVLYSASTMRNLCSVDKRLAIAKGYIEKDIVSKLEDLNKLSVPICEHCKQPVYEERVS